MGLALTVGTGLRNKLGQKQAESHCGADNTTS
jgi:hypothetical protein